MTATEVLSELYDLLDEKLTWGSITEETHNELTKIKDFVIEKLEEIKNETQQS